MGQNSIYFARHEQQGYLWKTIDGRYIIAQEAFKITDEETYWEVLKLGKHAIVPASQLIRFLRLNDVCDPEYKSNEKALIFGIVAKLRQGFWTHFIDAEGKPIGS